MKFDVIKVSYHDYPERFNRVIALRPNLDLVTIGYLIGSVLNCEFEHLFEIEDGNLRYVKNPDSYEDFYFAIYKDGKEHTLKDLNNHFIYNYDMGEGYTFDCEILDYQEEVKLEKDDALDNLLCKLLSGKGLGIFEDGKSALDCYLDGFIKPSAKKGKEEWEILPWNLDMKKFGDFDKEINLKAFDMHESEIDLYIFDDEDIPLYGDEYDDPFDDGVIDYEVLDTFIREQVAADIFNDPDINEKYRHLILKYDINYAYEMMVKCLQDAHKMADDGKITSDDIDDLYLELIEDLD